MTSFYLTNTASDLGGSGQMLLSCGVRGILSVTAVTNTTAAGTDIQVTQTAGGTALSWLTAPLSHVTISGSITVNVRGLESSLSANACAGVKIERCSNAGSVLSTIVADSNVTGTEYTTTDAASSHVFTPTSTAIANGERIKVTLYVKNVGTMATGFTVTNTYSGGTGSSPGDTFVTFTETVGLRITDTDTGSGADATYYAGPGMFWSGQTWQTESFPFMVGPGPNFFDSSLVSVDANGFLNMSIAYDGVKWRCSEINGPILGYGTYSFVVDADPSSWDPNFVLGMFVYDSTDNGSHYYSEVDIEFSKWGDPNALPVLYSNQPGPSGGGPETHTFAHQTTGATPYTVSFTIQANQIYWRMTDANGRVCGEHVCVDGVQPGNNAAVAINLWLQGGTQAPVGSSGITVPIRSFTFSPAATHALTAASALKVPLSTTFNTMLLHRPGSDAPDTLTPYVAVTNPSSDPPDGRLYPVASLIPGQNARYNGTYSIVVASYSWDTPATERTVAVTMSQFEFPGDTITASKQVTVSRTFTPNADVVNGIVVIGEMTLPIRDMAPENTDAYFAAGITSKFDNGTTTGDRFYDILTIDTMGQLVLVNVNSPGYENYFVDEPSIDRDLGRVLGSNTDRSRATSVLDSAIVSGGPLTVDPGSNLLLVYSITGAPGLVASYMPRWWLDRLNN